VTEQLPSAYYFKVVEKVAWIREQRSYGFAGVDHAPSAKADNEIRRAFPGFSDTFDDQFRGGFSRDRKSLWLQSNRAQGSQDWFCSFH